jgi:hypothetical protein
MLVSHSAAGRIVAALGIIAGLTVAAGCEGRSKRVPVAGQVLIDGQPLTGGHIWIEPANDRAASSPIDEQGRFRMTTYDDNDGCVLGTHKVAITSTKQLSPTQTQHLIPPIYRQSDLSQLTVTIDKPTEDLKIELTWGGKQPYVEDTGGTGDVAPPTGDAKADP